MADLTKILENIKQAYFQILGDQLDEIMLYGSRARGDAREDFDIDIVAILSNEFNYQSMIEKTSEVTANLSLENNLVISRAFVTRSRFDNDSSPFILNLRKESVAI